MANVEISNENMATLLTMLENNLGLILDWMDAEAKTAKETELSQYIQAAANFIDREGITIDFADVSDLMLITMYSSFLYEKRMDGVSVMPRALRYNLNNRLFQESLTDEG